MKRLHKTLIAAKKELAKIEDNFAENKIHIKKGNKNLQYKYWIGTDIEWLNFPNLR